MSLAINGLVYAVLFVPTAIYAAGLLPPLSRDAPVETGLVRTADVHHILVTDQITAANLLKEILTGTPGSRLERFKAVARRSSRDPSSGPMGGDLGTVFEGELVPSFERPVLAAKPGELLGPIKSEFGWHLAYVTKSEEKPVAPICRSALEQPASSPKTTDLAGLALAKAETEWSSIPDLVSKLLGPTWIGPLSDQNGDLVYLQRDMPADRTRDRILVTRHVDFRLGKLITGSRPMGCVRSIREQWEVDCKTRRIGGSFVHGYEARAATGRQLTSTRYRTDKVELAPVTPRTLGSQILEFGCSAGLGKERT